MERIILENDIIINDTKNFNILLQNFNIIIQKINNLEKQNNVLLEKMCLLQINNLEMYNEL